MKSSDIDPEEFQDPPTEYRPIPFWGLNDVLSDETLREQIREMKDKGWGGFFTHARYGLETPYLGAEYMERMKTCVDEAKRQGLQAWIYDEHPFPAGTAGGLVTAPDRAFRHKALVMRTHHRLTPIDPAESLGYFAAKLDDDGVPIEVRPIEDPVAYSGYEKHFLHFYVWTEPLHQAHQPGFSNYDDNIIHGFATSDNLNPAAVRRFIDVTYENFKEAVGGDFGSTVAGGFSDIPVYHWNYASPHPSVPWTTDFENYFKKEAGYDIIPLLPVLFLDVGDYPRVRADFWRLANKLFVESFTKQLHDWFDENGLIYTAHYWGEETLHWQIAWTGDVMAHFVHHHYVGIDHSIRNIEDPLGVKQASTVAEQLNKPRMVAETYGMSGNNLSHAERKWIADWEFALGANFLVPYIALYSFRGRRKRDEPASLFIQQAYWAYERLLYDYYGRLSYALTRGERVVDILVMQPLATAFAMYTPQIDYPQAHRPDPLYFEGSSAKLYQYNQQWMDLCSDLLTRHRDFHVGNEVVMAEFGKINNDRLVVGKHAYRVVIIPPSVTWSATTLRLLRDFANAGGTIIALTPLPTMIDGARHEQVLPAQTIVLDSAGAGMEAILDRTIARDIITADNADILYQHRRTDTHDIYFVANTSLTDRYLNVPISLQGTGSVELWDSTTGKRSSLAVETRDGRSNVSLDFYPTNSHLLVQTSAADPSLPAYRSTPSSFDQTIALGDEWAIKTHDPNVLVMDYAWVKVDGCSWTDRLPMWKAFRAVKQGGIGSTYTIRYSCRLSEPMSGLSLLMENPDRLAVRINGAEFAANGDQWWLDPAMRTFPVSDALKAGENTIECTGRLGIGTDIECCMLLGEFCLDSADGFLVTKPKDIVIGRDITKEGFPFYTGHVSLRKQFSLPRTDARVYLSFERVDATFARVLVNDRLLGVLPWEPYVLEITEAVKPGENRVEVQLVTTRHNLFGPHHDRRGEVTKFAAPHIWTNEVMWTDDYYFSPVGLTGAKIGFVS